MMIIKRCYFSLMSNDNKMIDLITKKLDMDSVEDYEVSDKIQEDVISLSINDSIPTIYIPIDLEYCQYDLDDYIRYMAPHLRTNTKLDRNIYMMKVSGQLNLSQLVELVKFIIKIGDFCELIKKE